MNDKKTVAKAKKEIKGRGEPKDETKSILKGILGCCIIIIALLLVNIMLVIGMASNSDFSTSSSKNDNNSDEKKDTGEHDISKLREISAGELASSTKRKNTVVYVGRDSCGWSVDFMPVLNQAIDEFGLQVLYIDVAKILDYSGSGIKDQGSYEVMMNLPAVEEMANYMSEKFGATPMMLIMRDGKIIDTHTGYTDLATLSSFLEKNSFSKNT
jgi:thiol-disulfide isomerase/thioredoxin